MNRKFLRVCIPVVFLVFFHPLAISAQPGWANMDTILAVLGVLPVGEKEFYAWGGFDSIGSVPVNHLVKWTPRGWQNDPPMEGWSEVTAVEQDRGGSLMVAGRGYHHPASGAGQLALWDGQSWQDFPLSAGGHVNALIRDRAGNVYAGGNFTSVNGVPAHSLALWDGSQWALFGEGADSNITHLALDHVSGMLYAVSHTARFGLFKKWDGTWIRLTPQNMSNITAVAAGPDGSVYLAGTKQGAGARPQTLFIYSGGAWDTIPHAYDRLDIRSLQVERNGTLRAIGAFLEDERIWDWASDAVWNGQSWKTGKLPDGTYGMAAGSPEQTFVFGEQGVFVLEDSSWSPVGPPRTYNYFNHMCRGADGSFYFSKYKSVYSWDGLAFKKLGRDFLGQVHELAPSPDGVLYAVSDDDAFHTIHLDRWDGKSWTGIDPPGTEIQRLTFDGKGRPHLVASIWAYRMDDTGWVDLGRSYSGAGESAWTGVFFGNAGEVYKIDDLNFLVRNDTGWVMTHWWATIDTLNWSPKDIFYDREGALHLSVFIGGYPGIVRWNGSKFDILGTFRAPEVWGPDINAFSFDSQNRLVAAGLFNRVVSEGGEIRVTNIARWDGAVWSPIPGDVWSRYDYSGITGMVIDENDEIHVAGSIERAGGFACRSYSMYAETGVLSVPPFVSRSPGPAPSIRVRLAGGRLRFENLLPLDRILVYTLNGKLLYQGTGSSADLPAKFPDHPLLLRIMRESSPVVSKLIH